MELTEKTITSKYIYEGRVVRLRFDEVELPDGSRSGKIEKGEDPFECGKRELKEEAGATAEHYELLGIDYPSPGYCGEKIYIYYADGLTFGENDLDEGEFLDVIKVPFDKAVEMVMSGEIKDSKTQIAILKIKAKRGLL